MASHSVGCLTAPFEANAGCRSTSAPTTIPFIGSTSGKPICEYWSYRKSSPYPTFPCPIHSWNGSSAPSTLNASRRKQLIQTACDIEEVLKAYEHLALRVFLVGMLIYELVRAALR
jgi:hypothetical protein